MGIVQYVSDASLDQISNNIKAELDAKGKELGVTFDYKPYFQNGEGDATVINQIASDLVADGVGHHRPHRHPHRRGDADRH